MADVVFCCGKCDYSGAKRQSISHFIQNHVDDEDVPYLCAICNFKTISMGAWNRHLKSFRPHKEALKENAESSSMMVMSATPYNVTWGRQEEKKDLYIKVTETYQRKVCVMDEAEIGEEFFVPDYIDDMENEDSTTTDSRKDMETQTDGLTGQDKEIQTDKTEEQRKMESMARRIKELTGLVGKLRKEKLMLEDRLEMYEEKGRASLYGFDEMWNDVDRQTRKRVLNDLENVEKKKKSRQEVNHVRSVVISVGKKN